MGSNQFVWILAEVTLGGTTMDVHGVFSTKEKCDAVRRRMEDDVDYADRHLVSWCWHVNGEQIRDNQGI